MNFLRSLVPYIAADFAINFCIDGHWGWLVACLALGAVEAWTAPVSNHGGPW